MIRDFEQDHGYRPSADDILYHLEQIEPERYNQNLGGIMNNEGEPVDEFGDEFIRYDTDPFGADSYEKNAMHSSNVNPSS